MSAWRSIFQLENISDTFYNQVDKNEAIGLFSMYLGMKIDKLTNFTEFSKQSLPQINHIINTDTVKEIQQNDRLIILHLAFLTHRSVIGNFRQPGQWINSIVLQGFCNYPGCKKQARHKDHIWPQSLGGPFEIWNFQGLCDFHNRMKSNSPVFNFSPNDNFQTGLRDWLKNRQWI